MLDVRSWAEGLGRDFPLLLAPAGEQSVRHDAQKPCGEGGSSGGGLSEADAERAHPEEARLVQWDLAGGLHG